MYLSTRSPFASLPRRLPRPSQRVRGFAVSRGVASSALTVNQARLWDAIHHTAQWGDSKDGGVRRLALTDEDRKVREWFVEEAQKYSATVKTDEIGNQFAVRPGQNNDLPPIGIGSHLDTQPTGGRYDGILGVQAGLEILRVLHEKNHDTYAPVAVINWTNEEGARFKTGMLCSAVWSGQASLQDAYAHTDFEGKTLRDELERIGAKGSLKASWKENPLSAHFEYHIEQGPVLEDANRSVGIVTGVQGMTWLKVNVKGRSQHCGTTPIDRRRDALLASCQMVSRVNDAAWDYKGLTTVGVFKSGPQSPGTIPGEVTFNVDICHINNDTMNAMAKHIRSFCQEIGKKNGCTVDIKRVWRSPAVDFHEDVMSAVRTSAYELVGKGKCVELPAGAGHDSVNTTPRCPTGMIFIPSKDGISHHPSEYSTPEHCALGTQVLIGAVLRFDEQLKARITG